jgi:hypothetical protein
MGNKGDPGPGAPAGIAAVFPLNAVVGLKAQIAISGTAAAWTDAAAVSFGSDIQVTKVRAASPDALVVDIQVSPTAMPGAREITVAQGGESLSYRNVFQVVPLYTTVVSGKAARGSLATVVINHNDPSFTFDDSWSGTAYTGILATVSPAGTVLVRDVKPHQVSLLVSFDTDTVLGMRDLRLTTSWKRPSETTLTFPGVFDVADLNEQTVMTNAAGSLEQPFDSALYKFTPATTSTELLASVTTTNGKGGPMLVLVPTGGHFSSYSMAFTNSYSFTPYSVTDYRFVVVDPNGTAGVDYAFSVVAPTKVTEIEPNEAISSAQEVTALPTIVTGATLSSAMDLDFYKVTVGQAEVGRSLRMRSRAGDYSTDVKIELVQGDGTAVMAPVDINYHEDARSPALTMPGDYYVKLSWGRYSTSPWSTYSSRYELLLNWE